MCVVCVVSIYMCVRVCVCGLPLAWVAPKDKTVETGELNHSEMLRHSWCAALMAKSPNHQNSKLPNRQLRPLRLLAVGGAGVAPAAVGCGHTGECTVVASCDGGGRHSRAGATDQGSSQCAHRRAPGYHWSRAL